MSNSGWLIEGLPQRRTPRTGLVNHPNKSIDEEWQRKVSKPVIAVLDFGNEARKAEFAYLFKELVGKLANKRISIVRILVNRANESTAAIV